MKNLQTKKREACVRAGGGGGSAALPSPPVSLHQTGLPIRANTYDTLDSPLEPWLDIIGLFLQLNRWHTVPGGCLPHFTQTGNTHAHTFSFFSSCFGSDSDTSALCFLHTNMSVITSSTFTFFFLSCWEWIESGSKNKFSVQGCVLTAFHELYVLCLLCTITTSQEASGLVKAPDPRDYRAHCNDKQLCFIFEVWSLLLLSQISIFKLLHEVWNFSVTARVWRLLFVFVSTKKEQREESLEAQEMMSRSCWRGAEEGRLLHDPSEARRVSSGCLRQLSETWMLGLPQAVGPPSLQWQCHVVSPHMLVGRGGEGGGAVGWRRHGHTGSLLLFHVANDTLLHACAAVTLFTLKLAWSELTVSVAQLSILTRFCFLCCSVEIDNKFRGMFQLWHQQAKWEPAVKMCQTKLWWVWLLKFKVNF